MGFALMHAIRSMRVLGLQRYVKKYDTPGFRAIAMVYPSAFWLDPIVVLSRFFTHWLNLQTPET
jgi:hypothetical protein